MAVKLDGDLKGSIEVPERNGGNLILNRAQGRVGGGNLILNRTPGRAGSGNLILNTAFRVT